MKSNTKLVIAIVAMFVVALSIVGFTYAFFTASVNPNSAEESIDIQAGLLKVNYASTKTIDVTNIVPGWASDGKMIYHPAESVDENGHITAISTDKTVDKTYDGNAVPPVQFSVENTGDSTNPAYYAIELTNITNQIASDNATDAQYLTVALYEGTWTGTVGTPIQSIQFPATGVDTQIGNIVTIGPGTDTDNYYMVVSYADSKGEQSNSMGKTIKATVEIIGLNKTGDNTYVDETGAAYPAA